MEPLKEILVSVRIEIANESTFFLIIIIAVNIDGREGAVGFTSVLLPFVYPVRLIKVTETGDVVRDKKGLCVLCKPGEPGEFIGKIVKNHPSREFDGYVDKKATAKKIAYDVMSKGDMWFRSGDLLTMDEFGTFSVFRLFFFRIFSQS